jgi:AAA15 family ATPase/GTPase
MRLKISGIGKIGDSEIELNGITVIAGENNTGKSTFGKVLYCMFCAFRDIKKTTLSERITDIARIAASSKASSHITGSLSVKLIYDIYEKGNVNIEDLSEDYIQELISKDDNAATNGNAAIVTADLLNNIKQSLSVSDEEIQKIIIKRYFGEELEGKINHVNNINSVGIVSLAIQGKNVDVSMQYNECSEFADNVGIHHKAIYMDTPFVMDDIALGAQYDEEPYTIGYNIKIDHRRNLRHRLSKERSNNTAVEEIILNKKVSGILSKIHSVANGEFQRVGNKLMFKEAGLKEPIPLSNVSAGIKTFLVIKRLLELGEIKERDVLILDEPEIHLNPSLQLQFAEVLVLLQKELNLTILLTSHSPYFLYAVEVYGKKHEIEEKLKFYFAESHGDTSDVLDVSDNVDTIYKQLAAPLQKLEDMAYEV